MHNFPGNDHRIDKDMPNHNSDSKAEQLLGAFPARLLIEQAYDYTGNAE
ncbi:hypothetical protein [Sphingobacterium pedocola]|nr:hypothetical protein [Sphingobacterium pedocola]